MEKLHLIFGSFVSRYRDVVGPNTVCTLIRSLEILKAAFETDITSDRRENRFGATRVARRVASLQGVLPSWLWGRGSVMVSLFCSLKRCHETIRYGLAKVSILTRRTFV